MLHIRPDYAKIQDPSCEIKEDEPVFLLKASDPFAVDTLLYFAEQVSTTGHKRISKAIENWAAKMSKWLDEGNAPADIHEDLGRCIPKPLGSCRVFIKCIRPAICVKYQITLCNLPNRDGALGIYDSKKEAEAVIKKMNWNLIETN